MTHQKNAVPYIIPKLRETLAIIYEMEGMAGVADYSKANQIPLNVCRKLLDAYAPVDSSGPKLKTASAPDCK